MAPRLSRLVPLCLAWMAASGACPAGEDLGGVAPRSGWRQHDHRRPKPPVVEPAGESAAVPAPHDAVVLFDGSGLGAWETPEGRPAGWKVEGGVLQVTPGAGPIQTKESFGDIQLHIEWASPNPPAGKGQDRGNSGVFLMGRFEIQVLDTYRADTYADGYAGAIYGQYPPLYNATRPPGEWQSYEIAFRRPRFEADGTLREPARITIFHNGVLVQNNEEPWGGTNWLLASPYEPGVERGPIQLQDHGHPVRFRNIWLRKLPERPAPGADDRDRPAAVALPEEALDAVVGRYEESPEPNTLRLTIAKEGGHLLLTLPQRPTPLRADPASATVFVLPQTDARLVFRRREGGAIAGVVFRVGDGEKTLKKVER